MHRCRSAKPACEDALREYIRHLGFEQVEKRDRFFLFLYDQEEVLQLADPTPRSNSIGQCVEFRRDGFIAERMACSTGRRFNHLPLLTSIREHNCHLSCVARVRLLVVLRNLVHVGFVDQVPHVVGFDPGVRKLLDERGTIQQGDRPL